MQDDYLAPRRCLRPPIPEIFAAAAMLDRAADAHLAGARDAAAALIAQANLPEVRAWTNSLWGDSTLPREVQERHKRDYLRIRKVADAPPHLAKADRGAARMPGPNDRRAMIDRDGYTCVFCGIPLIRKEVREALHRAYPDALPWGRTNPTQHAAFQCMWLQYDHLVPHSRGGDNALDNLVITCAPCNYGRWDRVVAEQGLIDPRSVPRGKSAWDGLERVLSEPRI